MNEKLINQEIEACILGTIITNNIYLTPIEDILEPKHFAYLDHQKIYEHILNSDKVANQMTLKNFFANLNCGTSYLSELLAQASVVVSIKEYATILIELWQKRELETIMGEIDLSKNFDDIKSQIEDRLVELQFATSKEPQKIYDIARNLLIKNEEGKRELLNLGFNETDKLIGGLEMGSFVIVAGKSSMGKTTLVLNFAKSVAKENGVLFFSVEVNEDQIASKILVDDGSLNSYRLRRNILNQIEVTGVVASMERLGQSKLLVDDSSGLTLSKIRAKLKRTMNKNDIKLIVIDYLQLMKPEGKDFSREQQVSKIAIGLKEIAKEFNIVVMALSQLSRASDSRDNRRPMLSDLRDSGSLEQAADVVAFIHRDEYYLEREKEPEHSKHYNEWRDLLEASRGKADLIISKNRNGEIGEVKFSFESQFGRFNELEGF